MQNKSSVGLWEMSSLIIDADKNLSMFVPESLKTWRYYQLNIKLEDQKVNQQ